LLSRTTNNDINDKDMLFLLLVTLALKNKLDSLLTRLQNTFREEMRVQATLNRNATQAKERVSWYNFIQQIPDDHFRRMFRMNQTAFDTLCGTLCNKLGINKFRPEHCLNDGGMKQSKAHAAQQHTGGFQ